MPIVLLIRHGENDYVKEGRLAGRLPGIHLNNSGLQQASKLARELADFPIEAIFSSPLDRTIETVRPLSDALHLKIKEQDELCEVDYGSWQGKTLKSLRRRKLWKIVQHSPSMMRFPDGESFTEAQTRIVDFLNRSPSMYKENEMIVCVTHSDLIKLCVAQYLGLHIDLFQRIVISPGSVSIISITQNGGRLISMNNTLSLSNCIP